MSKERRQYSREFKLAALARFEEAGNASELAAELGIERAMLYKWRAKFAAGGASALSTTGRPRPVAMPAVSPGSAETGARRRIAELERKVGEQQLELDFFRAALRQVRGQRRPKGGRGDPGSTR
jgi:transposase-like protein